MQLGPAILELFLSCALLDIIATHLESAFLLLFAPSDIFVLQASVIILLQDVLLGLIVLLAALKVFSAQPDLIKILLTKDLVKAVQQGLIVNSELLLLHLVLQDIIV